VFSSPSHSAAKSLSKRNLSFLLARRLLALSPFSTENLFLQSTNPFQIPSKPPTPKTRLSPHVRKPSPTMSLQQSLAGRCFCSALLSRPLSLSGPRFSTSLFEGLLIVFSSRPDNHSCFSCTLCDTYFRHGRLANGSRQMAVVVCSMRSFLSASSITLSSTRFTPSPSYVGQGWSRDAFLCRYGLLILIKA
jgi:hypothetical protein